MSEFHYATHDGPQSQAFTTEATELLYGGAAGGGKSFLMRLALITWALEVPGLQLYLFRRTYPELIKNHMDGPTSFPVLLAPWIDHRVCRINWGDMRIKFATGSTIHLSHCQYEKNRLNYHGAEIHVLAIDELTTFTSRIYYYLRGRVRMVGLNVPDDSPWTFPRIITASNPGGVGHTWVKSDFVTPRLPGEVWETPEDEGGMKRQYIPARLDDNPTLMAEDPGYYGRLAGLGSPELVKALREGSWDILEGAMFADAWDEAHNWVDPFPIPRSWTIYRSFDWGSSKPFSVGWWARTDGTQPTDDEGNRLLSYTIPAKSWIRIGEWYGWNGKANQGNKMTPAEVADGILLRERELGISGRVRPGAADVSIWDGQRGRSIHDEMASRGVRFRKAAMGPGSRERGWTIMRQGLLAAHETPMEEPCILIFNRCQHFRRTIPELPRDDLKTDDIDTDSEDHVADEARYQITMPAKGAARLPVGGA